MALTVAQKFEQDWADMVDDEPFLGKPSSSNSGTALESQDRPISNELSQGLLLLDVCKPPEACKPPAKAAAAMGQSYALPTGGNTSGLIPRTPAAARTPLSAKSKPFAPPPWAPAFYPAVSPAYPWGVAMPFGTPTKPTNDKGRASVKADEDEYTTVMLCGFPRQYNRDKLIDLLDFLGYACQFNFVYFPMDFEYSESVGYAFVNMITAADALRLKEFFDGFVGHPFTDDKPCHTNWSRVQGLSANVKQYRNSPVMHKLVPDEFKPVLLWNGQQQPFPEPTAALKQLRPHRKKEKEKAQGDPKTLND
mmetsp:Transcript_32520/g.92784  ORF Transcript_32520/g.92784 Transcript_32520/m.92784 type:complete len:307 (+) Transcript_32520:100-1020(+)